MNGPRRKPGTLRKVAGSFASRRCQNKLSIYKILEAKSLNQRRLSRPSTAENHAQMVAARHLDGLLLQLIEPHTSADIHIHHRMGGHNVMRQNRCKLGSHEVLIALHLMKIQPRPLKYQIAGFQQIVKIRFQPTQRHILVFQLADAESIGFACKIGVAVSQVLLQRSQDIRAARLVFVIKIPSHSHTSLKPPGTGG